MHPDPIQRVIEHFMRLPGIGPRQASRFTYTLLDEDPEALSEFGDAIKNLAGTVARCKECFRATSVKNDAPLCALCSKDISGILILEKDQDYETISKAGVWEGGYHILGGTILALNEKSPVTKRIRALYERVARRATAAHPIEIVLATSATTEGDSTALYIERILEPQLKEGKITLSRLGRGISTGAELEYADSQTLKNALKNRK